MTAAHPAPDKALLAQHRERLFGRALRYPVSLRERFYRWDALRDFPRLDLATQDRRQLQIQRLLGVVVDAHTITIGTRMLTCSFLCPSMDLYGRRGSLGVA